MSGRGQIVVDSLTFTDRVILRLSSYGRQRELPRSLPAQLPPSQPSVNLHAAPGFIMPAVQVDIGFVLYTDIVSRCATLQPD